jgi:hypothetical protein
MYTTIKQLFFALLSVMVLALLLVMVYRPPTACSTPSTSPDLKAAESSYRQRGEYNVKSVEIPLLF